MKKIVKSSGHCYDGMGLKLCGFWAGHNSNLGKNAEGAPRCLLFGGPDGVVKDASKSLNICDKIYGVWYEGDA